jgi:hypothetical protein
MMKPRYKVARSATIEGLERDVNGLIDEGYVPEGQPFMMGVYVCQAMRLADEG